MNKTIYVKVFKNSITFKEVKAGKELTLIPSSPFSTVRLLVGEFLPFERCLKEGIDTLAKEGFLPFAPKVVIQPMEMNEGGFSEIERRIFNEAALSAGARKVIIHEGSPLSDQEVLALFK